MLVFVDDSGDPGFKLDKGSSKVFVDSKENTLIQLTDMVVGSVTANYSGKDQKYFKMLKEAKRFEDIWEFK